MSLTTVSPILNMPTYLPTYLPTHSFFCYLYPCSNDYSTIWMVTHSSRLRAQLVSCALSKSVNIPSILHPLPFSVQCSIYISLWILMKKQKQGLNFCSRKNRIKVIHMSGYTILNKCWTYHSQHAQMTNPPIHACLPLFSCSTACPQWGPLLLKCSFYSSMNIIHDPFYFDAFYNFHTLSYFHTFCQNLLLDNIHFSFNI